VLVSVGVHGDETGPIEVLAKSNGGNKPLEAVGAVASTMGLSGYAAPADLEQAMLDVWALSEATSAPAA
jgi:glutamate dehydrogenase